MMDELRAALSELKGAQRVLREAQSEVYYRENQLVRTILRSKEITEDDKSHVLKVNVSRLQYVVK